MFQKISLRYTLFSLYLTTIGVKVREVINYYTNKSVINHIFYSLIIDEATNKFLFIR